MATKQIHQLPVADPAGDSDHLLVSQGGRTRRKRVADLRAEAFGDASIPASAQGSLAGATVRAQLGELDARVAAAVPKAAASAASPAEDAEVYARDGAGGPVTALVSSLRRKWLGGQAAAEVARALGEKLADVASVKDFGAKGDGATDDTAAFQAALDARAQVFVPAGRYRLDGEVQVKPRRTLLGAGRDATVIDARAARAFTFHKNASAFQVEPTGTTDWCRSRIGQMTIRMAAGGILAVGHEFQADGLRFAGGQPAGWCVELEDANECSLREIAAGTGGGGDDLLASGIRLYATEANRNVNYGDSLIEEISIKLKGANTVGVKVEHTGSAVVVNGANQYYVMNNLLFSRVQVNSAGGTTGTIGVWLKRVMRTALVNVDVEFIQTAFKVEGVAPSGSSGSCRHLGFFNCYVLNCSTPWTDSNAALPGSVMRCSFQNCNGFGLLNPVGVSSTDGNARAGEGDAFLPGALWLTEPNAGQAAVQIRSSNAGQLILTGDFHDGASPVRDGNPKNKTPRQALGIDVTSLNATQLYRPRGFASNELARLVLGNGEGFKPDGTNAAPLHRVEIADPIFLAPRAAEPPQPLNGLVVYCESSAALPAGTPWVGPGWYARLSSQWQPGVMPMGRMPGRERNTSFALSPLDFGQVHRANSASALTVTVGSAYTLGGTIAPLMQAGDPDAILWLVRQGTGDVTVAAGDSGVEIKSPVAGATTLRIRRQFQLVTLVLRFNAVSGKVEVYGNTVPDGEFAHEESLGWTNANQATNTDAAPYVVPANRAGQLLRISSSDAVSHVAFEAASVPAGMAAAIFRLCPITNPIRIMARSGGGLTLRRSNGTTATNLPCFQVNDLGRVVAVHVTGPSSVDPNQANSIYVEA